MLSRPAHRGTPALTASAGLLGAALAATASPAGVTGGVVRLVADPRPEGNNGVVVDPTAGGYAPWAHQPGATPRTSTPVAPKDRADLVSQECGQSDAGSDFAAPAGDAGGAPVACADGYITSPSARQVAHDAVRSLWLPLPEVRTAPPRGQPGVVGLPEWVWIPRDQWRPLSKRATAGSVWAQVNATPRRLLIASADGGPAVACAGPGTAYDPGRAVSAQESDCSFTFTRPSAGQVGGVVRVTVTVVWAATWAGSGGAGGRLPELRRSTTFPVRVIEVQSLYERKGTAR